MFFVFLVAQSDGQIIVLIADVFGIDDNALSLQIDNLALFQRAGNQAAVSRQAENAVFGQQTFRHQIAAGRVKENVVLAAGRYFGAVGQLEVQRLILGADAAVGRFQDKIAADNVGMIGLGRHVVNTLGAGNGNLLPFARLDRIDVDVFFAAEINVVPGL